MSVQRHYCEVIVHESDFNSPGAPCGKPADWWDGISCWMCPEHRVTAERIDAEAEQWFNQQNFENDPDYLSLEHDPEWGTNN